MDPVEEENQQKKYSPVEETIYKGREKLKLTIKEFSFVENESVQREK